jgi:hypothetical protein
MMKKRLVWATLLALVSTSVPAPTWADDEEDDADVPPFARGLVEKDDYRAMRDDYLNLVRGVPHFLPYEPRSRAIRDLERAEREIPSIDPSFWTEIGPAPIPNGQVSTGPQLPVSGRTISVAIHPSNPDIVYVGTAQGGVYRSTNGGTTWTAIFDSALSLAIGALALAPSDPEILYVGTGEPGGSADSFFGVGLYRINNASTTANLTGPHQPAGHDRPRQHRGVHGPSGQRDPRPPDGRRDHLRVDHGRHQHEPVERRLRPDGAAARHARRVPLDQRDVGVADVHQADGRHRRHRPAGHDRQHRRHRPRDGSADANRVVAWANGTAAANNGGAYLSTNALSPPPTFTQTLVTTTASVRASWRATTSAAP